MNISQLYCAREIGDFSYTEDVLFKFLQIIVFLVISFSFSCNIVLLVVVLTMQEMNPVRLSYANIIISDVILSVAGVQVTKSLEEIAVD